MDIESLKLILETLTGATEEATSVIIYFFMYKGVISLVGYVLAGAALYAAYLLVSRTIVVSREKDANNNFLKALRGHVDPSGSESYYVGESDRERIKTVILKAVDANLHVREEE